ncbi:M10 family metallopeptidase C-terminal domain-containing protein [Indioceanicola profundi]|uniref:M10 family metallopeptidase C-terminal domain-containing protein n=1 Tax=Indioceanicola profundi TaxID=2220096 RepID=UPI0013C401CC|nr:hypothetical protein [Indioceanicola profundi]
MRAVREGDSRHPGEKEQHGRKGPNHDPHIAPRPISEGSLSARDAVEQGGDCYRIETEARCGRLCRPGQGLRGKSTISEKLNVFLPLEVIPEAPLPRGPARRKDSWGVDRTLKEAAMPIIIDGENEGFALFGDTNGDLDGHARARGQRIRVDGEDIGAGRLIGDARELHDHARGGNDRILAVRFDELEVVGDALVIEGRARGGHDRIRASALNEAQVSGDAFTLQDRARGGDDVIWVGGERFAAGIGDAGEISGRARGGDDILLASGRVANNLRGDAERMSGNSRGGDDVVIGATGATNSLAGDATSLVGRARAGNDRVIGADGRRGAGEPETQNFMYGDGVTLEERSRGGNDVLVSGTFADDTMYGDAFQVRDIAQTGRDRFVFAPDNGNDRIWDFQPGRDRIDLRAFDFDDFSDVRSLFERTTDGLRITFDAENSIQLVAIESLSARDILIG